MNNYRFLSVEEKARIFEEYVGEIEGPVMLADFCLHLGRQTGKTTKLIQSLPSNESVIVMTWNYAMGHEIKSRVRELRPDIDVKRIHIVSHYDKECENKIRSLTEAHGKMDIYVDNAIYDMIALQYVKDINAKYGKYNDKK